MNEIRIKTFLPDGTESGEMTMPIDNVLTMAQFSFFLKLCRESDEKAGTQAIETIKSEIMARIAECKTEAGEYKSELRKKDGEKLEKKLRTVCPELKQTERKLKTIKKNQVYFIVNQEDGEMWVSAHVGDKMQTPDGLTVYIEKSGKFYRATEETTGALLKNDTLKNVKSLLLNAEKMALAKNMINSERFSENIAILGNAKSGKISRDKIEIEEKEEYKRGLIEMHLSDIYADAKKQAETSGTETDEAERFEAIIERLGYFYNELYNNSDFSEKYERPAMQAGDKAIKNYDSFIKYYVETRHDGLTSDREIAAFALALAEIGEISEIMPEKQKEQTRTEKIQEMLENGYISEYEAEHLRNQEESEPTTTTKGEITMITMSINNNIIISARKTDGAKIKLNAGRKSPDNGLYTVTNGKTNDLQPVTMTKLQHDDGRIDTISTTQNGSSVCIMTARTIDISGGIESPETTAQAVENPVETTATTEAETAEIKKFVKGTAYSANGLKFDCTGTKTGFIRILIDGENKPRIMSVFVKDNAEYITYQHKTVTAFDIYADDTPTDGTDSPTGAPDRNAPETILHTTETPAETPTEPKTGKAEETELLELPETKSIKFFYNGMKINGDKKITVKCSYDMDADGQKICIYASDYGAQIPNDVFDNVKNDSDIMTDYFDKDSCTVTPEHPLFKYIQYAAAKCELRGYKANRKETYEKFITVNPGQPTAADLSAVAKYNAGRAAAAKSAAEEKERVEQEEHDRQMSELCEFSDSMVKMTCEKYPIRENAPTVRIEWSEHPAFSDDFTMSISAAQILFSIFDEKQAYDRQKENHSGAWYYKTKFVIEYTDPETGEQSSYTGRQDFGDGEGGIFEHMMNHAEWERTHSGDIATYGKIIENPPETTDKLDFIKWLSQFLESSPDSDGTECPEIAMQTSTGSTADTPDSAQAQKQAIAVTFAPELKQAAEKHSENYAECKQIMNDIDTAVSALPPEDIAHILDTLPRDTFGALMARRICQQYAKADPANAAMLLGAWILDFANDNGATQ